MASKVEYVPERAMVAVTASGEIRNEDATAQATAVLRLLKANETTRVLADYSEAFSELSLPELYWLAERATMSGAPWRLRLAVLLPTNRYRIDSYKFFELVFRNAGYDVRLFEGRDAAVEWLAPPAPAPKPEPHCVRA
jgi:hypothetical protein